MSYYRLELRYERFIESEWDYTIHSLKKHEENEIFTNEFIEETGLFPTKSINGMYFFVDCNEEQATYIKMKYIDEIVSTKEIHLDIGKIDVNK